MTFCTYCGKEKVSEWTGYYKPDTGEKHMNEVCPDKPCEHGAGCDGVKQPFSLFKPDWKCRRCGNSWSSY